jgi:hypothetical protein
MKKFIINLEYFLQCAGNCEGCFLTDDERNSDNVFYDNVFNTLKNINKTITPQEELVIGFGRGNLFNLKYEEIDKLLTLINWCEKEFKYKKILFELSTSLIGKINIQVEKAAYILSRNKNIFFNVVLNSEITSKKFWENAKIFFTANELIRKKWGWDDNTGDILVLNINPKKLPDLTTFEIFLKEHHSPVNISLFPFDEKIILKKEMNALIEWTEKLWILLNNKDFNIKNFLNFNLHNDYDYEILNNFALETDKSYIFVAKTGEISKGTISIMGEVDYIRLLDKYNLKPDIKEAFSKMQKRKSCQFCEYQKDCLFTGAYVNFLINEKKLDSTVCASGYKKIFNIFNEEAKLIS